METRGLISLRRQFNTFLRGYFCYANLLAGISPFSLNFLDAVLTLFWVHNGFATEGNQLMASLKDVGYLPFLLVKIGIGGFAALVVWRWRSLRVAKYGLTLALTVYASVLGVHFFTGLIGVRHFVGRAGQQFLRLVR